MKTAIVLASLLTVLGCAVGPNYRAPIVDAPTEFTAARELTSSTGMGALDLDGAWWAALEDPKLVEYVERAVRFNHDIAAATARVREARALRGVAVGRLRPDVGASASVGRDRASADGAGIGLESDLFSAGFDASWELDVFGGNRRAVEAASARLDAQVEQRRDVLLSVVAEVARNYVELRGAQKRLAVARNNIRIQEDTLGIVEARFRVGLSNELDAARARALVETSRAAIPGLATRARAAAHRLAVLTGVAPSEVLDELMAPARLPAVPVTASVGLPTELLARRPDVRRAERSLHAATADIGIARAELYPRIRLRATAGLESASSGSLLDISSRTGSIGAGLLTPLFQGGRIRANIRATEARQELALAQFEQALLVALEEVETALVAYAEQHNETRELAAAASSSSRAYALAVIRYEKGLTDYLDVLDAERTLTGIEDRLADSETRVVTRWIALYKALAGGV